MRRASRGFHARITFSSRGAASTWIKQEPEFSLHRAADLISDVVSPNTLSMAGIPPSLAKNQMKRCLKEVLDPPPSKAAVFQLWDFFNSSCAYCGIQLVRAERLGHLDHIVSHSAGGTNDIHNHVLSCARCNADEKREEDWESFLARKVPLASVRQKRHAHIQEWIKQAPAGRVSLSVEERQAADAVIARALRDFEGAVEELRLIRRGQAP